MKRLSSATQFDILRVLDAFARRKGLRLDDPASQNELLSFVASELKEQKSSPIRTHGFRVQGMFSYVAAALGHCRLIVEEDCGTCFSTDGTIKRPDFRIVTTDGIHLLVEVKSFFQRNPRAPFKIKSGYVQGLRRYADIFGLDLKIAIYWSRWNIWTLIPAEKIGTSIEMADAVRIDEMATLGDRVVGTVPPLALRFFADTEKPRSVGSDGQAAFTIGRVALYAAGNQLTDPLERKLGWFFLRYGRWPIEGPLAKIEHGNLVFVEMVAEPEEATPDQGFEFIGHLSQMISSQYRDLTAPDGVVSALVPDEEPAELGVLIPDNYKGKSLPLWRIRVQPAGNQKHPS